MHCIFQEWNYVYWRSFYLLFFGYLLRVIHCDAIWYRQWQHGSWHVRYQCITSTSVWNFSCRKHKYDRGLKLRNIKSCSIFSHTQTHLICVSQNDKKMGNCYLDFLLYLNFQWYVIEHDTLHGFHPWLPCSSLH